MGFAMVRIVNGEVVDDAAGQPGSGKPAVSFARLGEGTCAPLAPALACPHRATLPGG